MKNATIYERNKQLFFRSSSQTTMGIWIDEGPCVKLAMTACPEKLGREALNVVLASRSDVPHPVTWIGLNDALLEAAQVRSWNTFSKFARCVNVELNNEFIFSPTQNLGSKGGFVALENNIITLPASASIADIGDALISAFAKSSIFNDVAVR